MSCLTFFRKPSVQFKLGAFSGILIVTFHTKIKGMGRLSISGITTNCIYSLAFQKFNNFVITNCHDYFLFSFINHVHKTSLPLPSQYSKRFTTLRNESVPQTPADSSESFPDSRSSRCGNIPGSRSRRRGRPAGLSSSPRWKMRWRRRREL